MSTSNKSKGRGRPQKITNEEILNTALTLLAEDQGELSIRKLALQLNTAPTAIYNRFGSKSELLTALAEQKLPVICFSPAGNNSPWQQQLEQWMTALRQQLLNQPGISRLLALHLNSSILVDTVTELMLLLETAGLSRTEALAEAQGTIWHVLGFFNMEWGAMQPTQLEISERVHETLSHLGIAQSALENFEQLWHSTVERNILGIEAKIARC